MTRAQGISLGHAIDPIALSWAVPREASSGISRARCPLP